MGAVSRIVVYVLLTVGSAWLARRLLGAHRVTRVRALMAGVGGCIAGAALAGGVHRWGAEDDGSVAGVAVITALLVAMGLVVAFQLMSRPRPAGHRRRRNGPLETWRVSRRSAEVVGIAVQHGLGPHLGRRGDNHRPPAGAQLRGALEEAGVVFVKFGQLLAARPDLVGSAIAEELSGLRHQVAALPRDVMQAELRRALPEADELFSSIDWEPLGSASIAQVYRATMTDGAEVVIKIRRPGIVAEVERDGQVARHLSGVVERHSAWARSVGMADLASAFVDDLIEELDYQLEARATVEIGESFAGTDIGVPGIIADHCTDDVLVMDRVPGRPLADTDLGHLDRERRRAEATALVGANVGAMLSGARFHADLHPGNVMITETGAVSVIDCGATGTLDAGEQTSLGNLLLGLRLREPTMLRDALLGVADQQGTLDTARLDRALAHLLTEHLTDDENIGPDAVVELLRIMSDHQLRLPASASAMFRGLVTVLDSLEVLVPDFPVLDAIEAVGDVQSPVPENLDDFTELAKEETLKLLPLLRRAPRLVDSVVTTIDRGDLTIRVRLFSHTEDARIVTGLVNRAVLAFVAGILGIVSTMLLSLDRGPYIRTDLSLYDLIAGIGLLAGAVLIMRVIMETLEDDPDPRR
ncbi:MAG: ABC1 kinase family protein [Acidimicrobiales bacterium]